LSRGAKGNEDVKGDTKEFADLMVHLVEQRVKGRHAGEILFKEGEGVREGGRGMKDGVKSVVGSWEVERVELIVDIPVWSPGCFQGECYFRLSKSSFGFSLPRRSLFSLRSFLTMSFLTSFIFKVFSL